MANVEWNSDLVFEFLNIYKLYPEIWDSTNPKHKNRNAVNEAWLCVQRELNVEFTIPVLKKKKECLMSTYRTQKKKVADSIASSRCGSDDIFTPSWYAYEIMDSFLGKTETSKPTVDIEEYDPIQEDETASETPSRISARHYSENSFKAEYSRLNQTPKRLSKRKSTETIIQQHMQQSVTDAIQAISNRNTPKLQADVCSLYGNLLTTKLRGLSIIRRTILTNKIDNLVFEAEMEELQEKQLTAPFSETILLPERPFHSVTLPHS